MRFGSTRKLIRAGTAFALIFLAACAKVAPQDTLRPQGPVARSEANLFIPVFWIAVFVFVFVEGLILFAVFKFKDRPGREEPKQVHGNSRLEFTWTLIPALILVGVAVPTVISIFNVAAKHTPNEVRVKVTAHQWWWEYAYEGTTPSVVTANELVIPVGRQVFLDLESADVIHSFWIPALAGKQDVVPERTNTLQFSAEKPGEWYGQCAEFCSISHANMRLRVIAKTPADYNAWILAQQAAAADPTSSDAMQGKDLFLSNACIQCHSIAGTPAAGTVGPNLTHFASRGTFAGATFDNTDENLFQWIKHAREQKPGVVMPNFDRAPPKDDPGNVPGFRILTDEQIRMIVAYLRSLM
jgi:cytochrome c oxidase subunit 2